MDKSNISLCAVLLSGTMLASCNTYMPAEDLPSDEQTSLPAEKFDLSRWNITLPQDENSDGKPDKISVKDIQTYSHPDFFFLNKEDHLVFAAPNKAATTPNSTNTRSELREMLRGTNTRARTHGVENNWVVEAREDSDTYGRVGGKLEATLKVDHVSRKAGRPDKAPAYSVVVGQIHAVKYDDTSSGFGYGNEPIKIYYKKWPEHETGSVFWTYERNLARNDPRRKDIAYPVFGFTWDNPDDPKADGIALGEEFHYTINVHRNTMYLTFESERHGVVTYEKSLVSNVNADDKVDVDDNLHGYRAILFILKRVYIISAAHQMRTASGTRPALVQEIGKPIRLMAPTVRQRFLVLCTGHLRHRKGN